jgi:DNA-binding MarR family transcriptional regulator
MADLQPGAETKSQSKLRLRTWLKILKTSNLIEKNLRERLRDDFQTTLPRFDVLSALFRAEKGMKMSQLSGVLKVSNGNVTGIIDRLVKDGHVIRVTVEGDRRANLVRLTTGGKKQFEEYASAHEAWVNDILGNLSGDDTEVLNRLLGTISKAEDA